MKFPEELQGHLPQPVPGGSYEVETGVHPAVRPSHPAHSALRLQELVELRLQVVDDGHPAVRIVQQISDYRQVEFTPPSSSLTC